MIFLVIFLILGGILAWFYILYGRDILALKDKANQISRKASEESFKASQTSIVYAEDGSVISILKSEKEVYYLSYNSIPKAAIDAVLVTEDRKFFTHEGIDYLANFRAFIALIKNKGEIKQGASTITQQLARTVFLTTEVSFERKVTELFLAADLDKKFTKQQILEFYLNNIYYANGYYGIQAASNGYFSKGIKELSLSQIAFLSAIPNNPTVLNPVTNFDNTLERRDKILKQMYESGVISYTEYNDALLEEIAINRSESIKHNYAESYTYYSAVRLLMEAEGFELKASFKNDEEKLRYEEQYYEAYYRIQRQLYTKGYRVYTSLDLEKQELLQKSINENLKEFTTVNKEGIYELQGAAVCIDNDTGLVVAIIGGRYQDTVGYTLNRAYQSFRQPGSAIKPLLIYTPLFERGYGPNTLVIDEKIKGGPKNANDAYSGEITLRRAVEVSKNTVAWNLLKELSPSVGLSYLLQMNFSHITSADYNLAIALGGFTYGVSPVEMTSGFASIANDGIYRTPTCVIKITDADGNDIVRSGVKEKKIYEVNAARMMTDVLTSVMKNGTGSKLALNHITTAGKTGTTTDRKDGWFIGYSKYYTTGVWVGCDYPKTINGLSGNSYPGQIWKDFMGQIHLNLSDELFEPYEDNTEDINKDHAINNAGKDQLDGESNESEKELNKKAESEKGKNTNKNSSVVGEGSNSNAGNKLNKPADEPDKGEEDLESGSQNELEAIDNNGFDENESNSENINSSEEEMLDNDLNSEATDEEETSDDTYWDEQQWQNEQWQDEQWEGE